MFAANLSQAVAGNGASLASKVFYPQSLCIAGNKPKRNSPFMAGLGQRVQASKHPLNCDGLGIFGRWLFVIRTRSVLVVVTVRNHAYAIGGFGRARAIVLHIPDNALMCIAEAHRSMG